MKNNDGVIVRRHSRLVDVTLQELYHTKLVLLPGTSTKVRYQGSEQIILYIRANNVPCG